jgi:hypothetical protein
LKRGDHGIEARFEKKLGELPVAQAFEPWQRA